MTSDRADATPARPGQWPGGQQERLPGAQVPGRGPSPSSSQPRHCAHSSHGATSDGVSQSGCPPAGNHTSPLSGAGEVLVSGVLLISVWPGSWYFEASEKTKQRKMELAGKDVRTGGGLFGG